MTLIYILIASLLISLISLVGVFTLSLKTKSLKKALVFLIALSAGTMMGGVFLHLLPEASELLPIETVLSSTLLSFILFFLIEKVLHWRHCHEHGCEIHSFGFMNLIGDGVHNFIDGLLIAGAFVVDYKLGIVTAIAVALHEIPQEIGDFGVLLHAGFSKKRALAFNFLSAITALLGAFIGFYLSESVEQISAYLLALAAGGFLYISASDLLPEMRKEPKLSKTLISLLIFLLGIGVMYSLKFIHI